MKRRRGVPFLATLLAVLAATGLRWAEPAQGATPAAVAAAPATPSCPASLASDHADYHGLTLTLCNFSGADLTKANFRGARLTAVVFVRARLSGADFTGATFADGGSASLPTDFSFADLSRAVFSGAKFTGTTYLTYATLTCADFSQTDLDTGGNAIFGDAPLAFQPSPDCRPKFQGTTMNCEFIGQWNQFDLTGAIVSACTAQLGTVGTGTGHDFSGGLYGGVVFDNLNLSRSTWTGAVLENASFQNATLDGATGLNGKAGVPSRLSGAKFNRASVQGVDLSHAQLYGANFSDANLGNSSFAGSFLTSNPGGTPPVPRAAVFDGAHLKNVTFANASLAGASFQFASLYGSFGGVIGAPSFPCTAAASACRVPTGFTCGCASASGADLTDVNFSNAFLYGVDFTGSGTVVNGTRFGSAILTGASFSGASFRINGGAAPDFTNAMLQGTVFDSAANLAGTGFGGAFLDFGAPGNSTVGNTLYLQLSPTYTRFKGWQGGATPCVQANYDVFSTVPATASMTCPDGSAGICGDGRSAASRAHWNGGIAIAKSSPVPGWYDSDASYDKAPADASVICGNGGTPDPNW